ncbi:hypothetical protein EW093_01815 [Thiospirochaeta perfilievii]|uniref:Uncharacterized protein n=1 Tax=Thiospirochaeta perfilievii TaxID=252967 RepID=A0A5C1Q7S3_9SPIO|nr:hypothetical protein [Thiospirochaeta perfilievii]QEN03491.1 hypothetical protein EW093_01815 [Thiospirochaeta perfilievii]
MCKKTLILFIILLTFGCTTIKVEDDTYIVKDNLSNVEKEIIIKPEDINKLRSALSDNILANSDPYYGDFASLILDLIRKKKWEFLSELTNISKYNSYVLESNGSLIDYSMYMLHTGDEGISTNYSIDNIENAFYTNSYIDGESRVFEGIYIYPTGETEFFKIDIIDSKYGLILTRE